MRCMGRLKKMNFCSVLACHTSFDDILTNQSFLKLINVILFD